MVKFMVKVGGSIRGSLPLRLKQFQEFGCCWFFTNELSVGKHSILVKPVSIKYSGSGKGTIKINESSKKCPAKTNSVYEDI